MRLWFLLLILLTGCCDPKFKFGDHVTVKTGFYKGCSGWVTSYYRDFFQPKYNVHDLKCTNGSSESYEYLYEGELDGETH